MNSVPWLPDVNQRTNQSAEFVSYYDEDEYVFLDNLGTDYVCKLPWGFGGVFTKTWEQKKYSLKTFERHF